MPLDVRKMVAPILRNYDEWVLHFIRILDTISCKLVYDGPKDFRDNIRDKTTYACSVQYTNMKKTKMLKSVFPIMIGSGLDICIRKKGCRESFDVFAKDDDMPFEDADIAVTFFLIKGLVRQLPYFFTNDPTNMHVIRNSIVRCYTYDADDRGKELSLYVDSVDGHRQGDLVVVLNDGSKTHRVENFFDDCEYPTDQDVYMSKIHKEGRFKIDDIGNKQLIGPGHLFTRQFVKYLYRPIRDSQWDVVRSKLTMIQKSIDTGTLLHVLSRKTVYFKESRSTSKMVSTQSENHREIGTNGEVYVEKNTGCYRDVTMQTYPLNPYMSHMAVRQISNKVKSGAMKAYHESYLGYFCILGTLETKNVGRTHVMVKDTYVSTPRDVKRLYSLLNLEPSGKFFVVVNEACIPVTEKCFRRIDLLNLKRQLQLIECYEDSPFIIIRYKEGMLFRKLEDVWVTPRDEAFWARRLYGLNSKKEIVGKFGYDYLTGYHVELNPYFRHNFFPKNILAFNALKNAVLAMDQRYLRYFMETVSAYSRITPLHRVVCEPVDSYSKHFVMYVPKVTVVYGSFKGNNQEDCIVVREKLDVFDCFQFYTVRVLFKLSSRDVKVVYHPVVGDPDDNFLGTVVCHGNGTMELEAQTTHVKIIRVSDRESRLYFSKSNFRILQYDITNDRLAVCLDRFHPSGTGDKLCSFHGQKGVMRKMDDVPLLDESVEPDLVVNPYHLFRMTPGQIIEGLKEGDGKDARTVRNSDGRLIPDSRAFYAKTFYFSVAYFASEHIYAPAECIRDKIHGQAVKGRSRGGGMRLGNMEIMNGMRGNGIAACFQEKVLEHGDQTNVEGTILPKSALLCAEDAKFYKCRLDHTTESNFEKISKKKFNSTPE